MQRCTAQRNGGHVLRFARTKECTESGLSACFTLYVARALRGAWVFHSRPIPAMTPKLSATERPKPVRPLRSAAGDRGIARSQRLLLLLETTGEVIFSIDLDRCCNFIDCAGAEMPGLRTEQVLWSADATSFASKTDLRCKASAEERAKAWAR